MSVRHAETPVSLGAQREMSKPMTLVIPGPLRGLAVFLFCLEASE